MKLLVGLGNPGREYEGTRHNVGFETIDVLAERAGATFSEKKFKARLCRARVGSESCTLMKPETFMNLSGESVGPALGFYKLTTADVIVVHDDLDLEMGRVKLKQGGGHGGHNGLRSLLTHFPDDAFVRVRIGVGRPPPAWNSADYVLSKFRSDERVAAERALSDAADAVEAIFRDGLRKAMNDFNRTQKASEDERADQ